MLAVTTCAAACWAAWERRSARAARADAVRTEEIAGRCELTGLPLRQVWMPWAEQATAKGEGELAFLDLDGFKAINDRLGHQVGDALLTAVADRLIQLLPNARIGRAGGDEFVVISAAAIAWEDTTHALQQPYHVLIERPVEDDCDEVTTTIGVSVGVDHADGRPVNELLHSADQAMYKAKRSGGGVRFAGATEADEGSRLTQREREIAELIAQGRTNKEIAEQLFLAESTVKWFVRVMRRKIAARGGRDQVAETLRTLGFGPAAAFSPTS